MRIPIRGPRFINSLCLFGFLAVAAMPLSGQKSTTRGLNLGVHLQAASLTLESGESDSGGGMGFRVGYGLNRIVTLYFEADGVSVDSENSDVIQGTWKLGHVDLGARFHFASTLRSWVPYLEVAVGGRTASVTDVGANGVDLPDFSRNGGAFSFGGGIYAYFKETLALDVGLKLSGGEFTEVRIGALSQNNLDLDASSTRFKIGIVWWP